MLEPGRIGKFNTCFIVSHYYNLLFLSVKPHAVNKPVRLPRELSSCPSPQSLKFYHYQHLGLQSSNQLVWSSLGFRKLKTENAHHPSDASCPINFYWMMHIFFVHTKRQAQHTISSRACVPLESNTRCWCYTVNSNVSCYQSQLNLILGCQTFS